MLNVLLTLFSLSLLPQTEPWVNVCVADQAATSYCENVGKGAYNTQGTEIMRSVRLGTIVGVAWRPKGSTISLPSFPVRTSPRDAFYYIIDDGGGQPFIRQCREIGAH